MTADFVDAARVEAGEFDLHPDLLDARTVAERSMDMFTGASPHHRFELAFPNEPVWLTVDPLRLEQVLINLISNAIKYSPDGGCVRVEVASQNGSAVLSVTDDGVGLGEDEVRRIFEPFHRGRRLKSDVPGSGLGLSIIRRIVEAHDGTIEVRSRLGAGSTFTVTLPVETPETAALQTECSAAARGRRTIDI